MMDEKHMAKLVLDGWKREIERAIRRAKRPKQTELDRWFRREWHRAEAISQWPEWRQRLYRKWRRKTKGQFEEPEEGCGGPCWPADVVREDRD